MTDYVKEYHSAISGAGGGEADSLEPLDNYQHNGSIVVQHDIHDGMLDIFSGADVIYTEPAWRHGYEKFMEKADKPLPKDGFERYMMALNTTINEVGVPAYVIGGNNNLNWLKPDDIHEVTFDFHNTECYVMLWNGADVPRYDVTTVADVVNYVADNYRCALDPCAGTGRTARAMADRDKSFICADVNGKCIRFIAQDVMDA